MKSQAITRRSSTEYQCDESDTAYGEQRRHLLDFPFVAASIADFDLFRTLERFFGIAGNAIARVNADMFLTEQRYQVGDIINITHSKLPLIRTGAMGWTTEGCIVTDGTVDFSANSISPIYEMYNIMMVENADIQDISVVSEGDIDRTAMAKEADHAEDNLTANDAYLAQATRDATNVMVEIELTPPGNAGGSNNRYITLYVQVQEVADTNIKEEQKRLYYDERSSDVVKAEFYVLNPPDDAAFPMTSKTYAQVRVHWTATSGGTEPTGVKLTKVKFWDFKATLSSTVIDS